MKPNRIWGVLAQRAEAEVNAELTQVRQVMQRVEQLAANRQRLLRLRADYAARLAQLEAGPHIISESMLYRRYIDHVEALIQQLGERDMEARAALAEARERHRVAEAELSKMNHLVDRDAAKIRRVERVREERDLNSIAIARFNRR